MWNKTMLYFCNAEQVAVMPRRLSSMQKNVHPLSSRRADVNIFLIEYLFILN